MRILFLLLIASPVYLQSMTSVTISKRTAHTVTKNKFMEECAHELWNEKCDIDKAIKSFKNLIESRQNTSSSVLYEIIIDTLAKLKGLNDDEIIIEDYGLAEESKKKLLDIIGSDYCKYAFIAINDYIKKNGSLSIKDTNDISSEVNKVTEKIYTIDTNSVDKGKKMEIIESETNKEPSHRQSSGDLRQKSDGLLKPMSFDEDEDDDMSPIDEIEEKESMKQDFVKPIVDDTQINTTTEIINESILQYNSMERNETVSTSTKTSKEKRELTKPKKEAKVEHRKKKIESPE